MSLTQTAIDYLASQSLGRIHPRRVIGFGLDAPDIDTHLIVPSKRNVP